MESVIVTFDVTSQLINNFRTVVLKLKNERYASIGILKQIFKIIEDIIDASEQKISELKEELSEVSTIEEQKEVMNKNYYLVDALNYIFPLLRNLTFSTINFIDFDDYAIINFIQERIGSMTFFQNKEIVCLISASLGELNFKMSTRLFHDTVKEYFSRLNVKFPDFSLHIRYPLIFKDNFLIKTAFFHEFSHLIDILLEISKNYSIDFDNYEDKINSTFEDFRNLPIYQGFPEDFLEDLFFVRLNEILANWTRELITDIISVILLGPASRTLLLFWNLTSGHGSYNSSHPPFYLRCRYLSKLLEIEGYKNLDEENKAIVLSEKIFDPPPEKIFHLIIEIFESEMEKIISSSKDCFNLGNSDILDFLIPSNPEKRILLNLVKNNIPIGVYLPVPKNENEKKRIIKYEKNPIFKILNVFWEYYFKILFNEEKEIKEKLDLFKKIEERAKKSIDMLRGFQIFEKFNR